MWAENHARSVKGGGGGEDGLPPRLLLHDRRK